MRIPPPGRLVDLGDGRRIHVQLSGTVQSGRPSVVLEAGLAATSLSWPLVQPAISESARVMSYDRAGLGWSDDAPHAATAGNAAADLYRLLRAIESEFPPPYILVGHSLGGLIVRIFQQHHPDLLTGLVLVDPAIRSEWRDPSPESQRMLARGVSLSRRGATLARLGIVRLALKMLTSGSSRLPKLLARASAGHSSGVADRLVGEVRKIPKASWPAIAENWSQPRSFTTMADYIENLAQSCSELNESRSLGPLPVVVLSAGTTSPQGLAEHEHDASLSTRGEHRVLPGTGHWLNLDAPGEIVDAVRQLL